MIFSMNPLILFTKPVQMISSWLIGLEISERPGVNRKRDRSIDAQFVKESLF